MKYIYGGFDPSSGKLVVTVKEGIVTLTSGVAFVADTLASSSTQVQLTLKSPSGTLGEHYCFDVTDGAGITIKSIDSSGLVETSDTSSLSYLIFD